MQRDNIAPEEFNFAQIKQKFGELRVYTDGRKTASMKEALKRARRQARETCEECGLPASLRTANWVRTQCDDCNQRYLERVEERRVRAERAQQRVPRRERRDSGAAVE